jgi:hypothetical protein
MLLGPCAFAASPADRPVMQITAIQIKGDVNLYLEKVKLAIQRQHAVAPGIGTRIFRGTLAGDATGVLYIVLEYRNLEFLAESMRKLRSDAEWNRLRAEAGIATDRVILSDSLFEEVTPQ